MASAGEFDGSDLRLRRRAGTDSSNHAESLPLESKRNTVCREKMSFGNLQCKELSGCVKGNCVAVVIHSTSQNRRSYPTG